MPFPFDLTEDATSDLEEIVAYIAVDNQRAALKVADELESAFRFLADWPFAGHTRQDLTDSEVRFWPNGRYLIVYADQDSTSHPRCLPRIERFGSSLATPARTPLNPHPPATAPTTSIASSPFATVSGNLTSIPMCE